MMVNAADRARLTIWLVQALPAIAPEWLAGQRWFGGKTQAIDTVGVEDVFWLPVDGAARALIVLTVRYAGAARPAADRYAIVAGIARDPGGLPSFGRLPWQPDLHAVETATEDMSIHALLSGLPAGVTLHGDRGGEVIYADTTARANALLCADPAHRPAVVAVGVEQSNTSVRVGSSHVFKLFRRLEAGDNPQLEIGRYLATTPFRAAPPLEGSLVYRAPGQPGCALGALEGWVANQGDGWSYVVAALKNRPHPSAIDDRLNHDLHNLGTTTADFHAALASQSGVEAFRPEPVTVADQADWYQLVRAQAAHTLALVAREHGQWSEPAASLGQSLRDAESIIAGRMQPLGHTGAAPFNKIRIHGDFHLGQTLKTQDGFTIIDFEGEPTKALAERRRKQCALRDLAGMVRSLDYAAAVVNGDGPARATVGDLRHAFIGGYRARAEALGSSFLPPAPAAEAWMQLFELEKALYEVDYEANNRPSWVHIPLGAVARILLESPGRDQAQDHWPPGVQAER